MKERSTGLRKGLLKKWERLESHYMLRVWAIREEEIKNTTEGGDYGMRPLRKWKLWSG